ncbi:hypothetical protein [Pseudoalteromonas carrageenovora]|uniref:hypothetical protein n=1 Tax=Pseudoalteromonas carrageenovora TaxID=227 RepID=UPI0026E43FD1|nr:hypothetical protein [Pseudoalteromonas carrageenovora]MDO6547141.1 hypothetical protein [Pseudoalteromonas carrageenovora]MDO6831589.1 hypothetical protein [Pseudoalteromonas carrageenovora]
MSKYFLKNMNMFIILIFLFCTHSSAATTTADIKNNKPLEVEVSTGLKLPLNFELLTQKKLLGSLNKNDDCSIKDEHHNNRFVSVFKLSSGDKLLALACHSGAYQDSYLTYYINVSTNMAYPITWEEPTFIDNKWKLKPTNLLTGSIEVSEIGNQLKSLRLFSAFGSCGYEVNYTISFPQLINLKPSLIHADNDCGNGILVDEWPIISNKN